LKIYYQSLYESYRLLPNVTKLFSLKEEEDKKKKKKIVNIDTIII